MVFALRQRYNLVTDSIVTILSVDVVTSSHTQLRCASLPVCDISERAIAKRLYINFTAVLSIGTRFKWCVSYMDRAEKYDIDRRRPRTMTNAHCTWTGPRTAKSRTLLVTQRAQSTLCLCPHMPRWTKPKELYNT